MGLISHPQGLLPKYPSMHTWQSSAQRSSAITAFPDVTVYLDPAQTSSASLDLLDCACQRSADTPVPIKTNHGRRKIRDFHNDLDGERIGNMDNGVGAGNSLQYIPAIKIPVYIIC